MSCECEATTSPAAELRLNTNTLFAKRYFLGFADFSFFKFERRDESIWKVDEIG